MIAFVKFITVSKTESFIGNHQACAGALAKHIFIAISIEVKAVNNTLLSQCLVLAVKFSFLSVLDFLLSLIIIIK